MSQELEFLAGEWIDARCQLIGKIDRPNASPLQVMTPHQFANNIIHSLAV